MKDDHKKLTTDVGAPVADNTNSLTAGERGGKRYGKSCVKWKEPGNNRNES